MMLSGGSSSPSYCWSSCFCGGRLLTTKGKHADDLIVIRLALCLLKPRPDRIHVLCV